MGTELKSDSLGGGDVVLSAVRATGDEEVHERCCCERLTELSVWRAGGGRHLAPSIGLSLHSFVGNMKL